MKLKVIIVFCFTISSSLAADEHRLKVKDQRDKRNLEYSISHNYPTNFRNERRLSNSPSNLQLPVKYQSYFGSRPHPSISKRIKSDAVPPYAVQMEPLVQYSQRDPLYDNGKAHSIPETHNDLTKPDDLLTDNNHLAENVVHHTGHGHRDPIYYQKEPEPIIEIIIKESNVSLPPVPVPIAPPKKKEPVQVFYVKYKKNPNGTGKDSIIYDTPVPALNPVKEDEPRHHHIENPVQEYVTAPPPPSTTIRTIIRPESETYIGTKGLHVTFGSEHRKDKPSDEGHVESAPQPSVVFPNQNRQSYVDQRPHFSQPIPNFNVPYQQQTHQQLPTRDFQNFNQKQNGFQHVNPPSFQQRPQLQQSRPFGHQQQHQFQQRPVQPPHQIPPHQRYNFNQNPQFQVNQHATLNHQNFGNQPPRSPFSFFNRPQTHFPIPQSQTHNPLNHHPNHNYNTINFQNPQLQQHQQPLNHHNQQTHQQPLNHHNQQAHQQPPNQHNQQTHPNHPQQPYINPYNQQYHNTPPQNIQPNNFHAQQPQNHNQFFHQNQHSQNFQQLPHVQQYQQFQQLNNKPAQQSRPQFTQQTQTQHFQNHQQNHHFLPPGGELIKSVPKFEQHLQVSVDANGDQVLENINAQPVAQAQIPFDKSPSFTNTQNLPQNHKLSYQSTQSNHQQSFQQFQSSQDPQRNLSPIQFRQQILDQFETNPDVYNEQSNNEFSNTNQQQQAHQENQKQLPQSKQQFSSQQNLQKHQTKVKEQESSISFQTSPRKVFTSTTQNVYHSTTTRPTSTTTRVTETTTQKQDGKKATLPPNIQLPDEVPDELREQLLASGILSNADISVLDYDKVGDIPIESLPPEQLANFYGAGGAQQIGSASEQKETVVAPGKDFVSTKNFDGELETEASEIDEVKTPIKERGVEMKVVRYDPETKEGQAVQDKYVRDDATQVDPVVLNDEKYNKYLPIKISGAQFPIPDVPELRGRNVTSVVVLAPIYYEYDAKQAERIERDASENAKGLRFIAGDALKQVIKNPTLDNYKSWLQKENSTTSDKQSVVLLVTGDNDSDTNEKEIYMYDVATQRVSKLSGELSSAFVEAAESNVDEKDIDAIPAASNVRETVVPFSKIPHETGLDDDLDGENSDISEQFIDVSDVQNGDLLTSATSNHYPNQVLINSGYSKTGMSRPSY